MEQLIMCNKCKYTERIDMPVDAEFVCPECGEVWTYRKASSKESMDELDSKIKELENELNELELKREEDNGVVDFKKAVAAFSSLCCMILMLAAFDDFNGELSAVAKFNMVMAGAIGTCLCISAIPITNRNYKQKQQEIDARISETLVDLQIHRDYKDSIERTAKELDIFASPEVVKNAERMLDYVYRTT